MKKIYVLPLLLLLITQPLFSQYSSNGIGRWKLGLNVGATWQTANINSKPFDLGYGATLEYAVYQKYNSFFGFSLRGRFLRGRTTGYNKLLHNQPISNDNINGLLDTTINYSSLPLYLNNRTKLNEFSLEAMLKWNKLYQNHGILFYLYLGGGFTQYTVHTDQLDEFGNLYDYSSIDPGSSSTVDQLESLLDGDFETELSNVDYNSMVFTPAFGVGFGFRIAPGFDIAWEHKVSLPQTDLFEGQEYSTSDPSFVKDIYHYSSLGLIFSIVGDVEPSVYTPPVEPAEPIVTNPIPPTTPIEPITPQKPIITLIEPKDKSFDSPNCKVKVVAKIENVTNEGDIEFYQNGKRVPSYLCFFSPPTFKSTVQLEDGKNEFKIVAKNKGLTDTKTFDLTCINNKKVSICLNNKNLTVFEKEWDKYAAQGAVRGKCPEEIKKITICLNNKELIVDENLWPNYVAQGAIKGKCPVVTKNITICLNNKELIVDEKLWPNYAAQGAIKGKCPVVTKNITICLNNKEIIIDEKLWPNYAAQGAIKGKCPVVTKNITVCLNNKEIIIDEKLWPSYAAQGAIKGKCPVVTKNITICLNNKEIIIDEKLWPSYAAQGAIKGKCPVVTKNITICLNNKEIIIDEKLWPNYAAQGAIKGKCPVVTKNITICLNNKEIIIDEKLWPNYAAQGAIKGKCPEPVKKITICLNNKEVIIDEKLWPNYAAQGATKGDCPIEQKKITICHNIPGKPGETQTITIPESLWNIHKSHGDVRGECKPVDKLITICHVITDPKELSTSGQVSPYKTMQIRESEWAAHAAHGDTKGACVQKDKNIEICHNIPGQPGKTQTITIKESEWNLHKSHGDLKRPCAPSSGSGGGLGSGGGNTEKKIKICHIPPGNNSNPQTIEIPESAWPAHQAHGDTKGACKSSSTGNSGGGLGTGNGNNSGSPGTGLGSGNNNSNSEESQKNNSKNSTVKGNLGNKKNSKTSKTKTKGKTVKKLGGSVEGGK